MQPDLQFSTSSHSYNSNPAECIASLICSNAYLSSEQRAARFVDNMQGSYYRRYVARDGVPNEKKLLLHIDETTQLVRATIIRFTMAIFWWCGTRWSNAGYDTSQIPQYESHYHLNLGAPFCHRRGLLCQKGFAPRSSGSNGSLCRCSGSVCWNK
jgi:hypothetical protein